MYRFLYLTFLISWCALAHTDSTGKLEASCSNDNSALKVSDRSDAIKHLVKSTEEILLAHLHSSDAAKINSILDECVDTAQQQELNVTEVLNELRLMLSSLRDMIEDEPLETTSGYCARGALTAGIAYIANQFARSTDHLTLKAAYNACRDNLLNKGVYVFNDGTLILDDQQLQSTENVSGLLHEIKDCLDVNARCNLFEDNVHTILFDCVTTVSAMASLWYLAHSLGSMGSWLYAICKGTPQKLQNIIDTIDTRLATTDQQS